MIRWFVFLSPLTASQRQWSSLHFFSMVLRIQEHDTCTLPSLIPFGIWCNGCQKGIIDDLVLIRNPVFRPIYKLRECEGISYEILRSFLPWPPTSSSFLLRSTTTFLDLSVTVISIGQRKPGATAGIPSSGTTAPCIRTKYKIRRRTSHA